ncbi:Adenylate-forming Reductase [Pleurotus pulmonarius]
MFQVPPVDGSLTIPEIWDWHSEHNPTHAAFEYEAHKGGVTTVSYRDVVSAAHEAARILSAAIGSNPGDAIKPRIAIVAATDTITFFCVILGVLRVGICTAIISPHNSPAAVAHLLAKVEATHVFVSDEHMIKNLVEDARRLMDESNAATGQAIKVSSMPTYEDLVTPAFKPLVLSDQPWFDDRTAPLIYMHTSGSTSLPKPLAWNHTLLLQVGRAALAGAESYVDQLFAWHCVSMSHGTGVHLLSWIPMSGFRVGTFPPQSPARFPSSEATFMALERCHPDYVITFPYFIEMWCSDPRKVEILKSVKELVFVGGFLNTHVGNTLVMQGVRLQPLYGVAEAGVLGSFLSVNQGIGWEYFSMTPDSGTVFLPVSDELYELILDSSEKELAVINTSYQGRGAYNTGDLFLKHATKEGFWKPIGRKDDLLILSSGKKESEVNPVPFEHILNNDPRIRGSLMFGHRRFQCGVLIELKDDLAFDAQDESKTRVARRMLGDVLMKVNTIAGSPAKIYPEMVIFASKSKPFTYTEKGSIRRAKILAEYKQEVDALYERPSDVDLGNITIPTSWTPSSAVDFSYAALKYMLPDLPGPDEDIFYFACDSLQAARIERMIVQVLKSTGAYRDGSTPPGFIYNHSNARSLGQFMLGVHGQHQSKAADGGNPQLQQVLTHFASGITFQRFHTHPPLEEDINPGKVVLVTGTTGGLGANVLHQLLQDQLVQHIYTLNRCRPGEFLREKQVQALRDNGLDPEIAKSPKITALCGDLRNPTLGLDDGVLNELRRTVTHIVHLAWPVDWKLKLGSFEGMLFGVVNLINLALSSELSTCPRFLFASSIGVFNSVKDGDVIPEELLGDIDVSLGRGYSEAKAISEGLLRIAAGSSSLRPVILRIGQVAGSVNGAWKTTEWFPSLVKTSVTLGALPSTPNFASWLPAELAGKAIGDLLDASAPVINLVHPKPTPISDVMHIIASDLRLPLIPYDEWLLRLETSQHSADEQPAVKMLDFYQRHGLRDIREESCLGPTLSASLASAPPLDSHTIRQWVAYWRSVGLL